jgi:hypothetical protein
MLKKEISDSLKTFFLCLLLLLGVPLGYGLDKILIHFGWMLSEFFNFMFVITLCTFSVTSGLTIFQSEKKDRAFEYLFSLPLSRFRILMHKIFPRFVLLLLLILISVPFSVFDNIWFSGFNLVVLFLISVVMSISFSSLLIGVIGISFFFWVYYLTSQIINLFFIGFDPQKIDSAFPPGFHSSLLVAALLLIPLGSAFWVTFKKLDLKPLKLQMKSYYSIVLPTLIVFVSFIILTFKRYLSYLAMD